MCFSFLSTRNYRCEPPWPVYTHLKNRQFQPSPVCLPRPHLEKKMVCAQTKIPVKGNESNVVVVYHIGCLPEHAQFNSKEIVKMVSHLKKLNRK